MSRALIFDCDGVLADTERDGHLPAFNEMFKAMGLPIQWGVQEYGRLLSIGGGKERLATLLTTEFVNSLDIPTDRDQQKILISKWHEDKTARYTDLIRRGDLPGRPGIRRIVSEAYENGWRLAVASTSAEKSVRAVLDHVVGSELAKQFRIFAGDVVARKKPAPDIYLLAVKELGVDPHDVLVVEDSPVGLQAARAAGLKTIVTTSGYTREDLFPGAALVVTSLGDSNGDAAVFLENPYGITVRSKIELRDLVQLFGK